MVHFSFFIHLGSLQWKHCTVNCKFITLNEPDENGFSYYLLHLGHHIHQRCLQNKPFNQEKDELKERVSAAPETLPKKMQVGQSLDNNNPLASVRKISKAFSNTDRIAYYRRQIINEENIITKTARRHGDNFVLDIFQFQQDHPNFIRKVDFTNKGIIVLQTDWMQQQGFSINNFSGIITDSTYKYFSNAFLLSRYVNFFELKDFNKTDLFILIYTIVLYIVLFLKDGYQYR